MDSVLIMWLILAAALIIAEIFSMSFAAIWFGIGAAAAALMAYLKVGGDTYGLSIQIATFIVVSVVLFLIFYRYKDKINSSGSQERFGAERHIGQEAIVTEEINHIAGTGRIEVSAENWLAISINKEIIPVGGKVIVKEINGTKAEVIKE